MLIKMNLTLPTFARQEHVQKDIPLSRKAWINIDRIVMLSLFVSAIVAVIIFS